MYLETVRIVADWLKRDDYGVNAMLKLIQLDGGDTKPPAIVNLGDGQLAILDETRHIEVATHQDPPGYPALYIMTEGDLPLDPEPTPGGQFRYASSGITVVIRYLTANDEIHQAVQDGYYTLRAVLLSLRHLTEQANESYRIRNGVQIIAMTGQVVYVPLNEAVGRSVAAGALIPTFHARDAAP